MFTFRFVAIGPFLAEILQSPYLTLKIKGQGHGQDQTQRWHLRPRIQSIRQCHGQGQTQWWHLRPRVQSIWLPFVSLQSENFWLRYSNIWPWKFKAKVMAKIKPNGDIWGLEFNRYVCSPFRGNRTIANSRFALENSRSRSRRKSTEI